MDLKKLFGQIVKGKLTSAAQKMLLVFGSTFVAYILPIIYALSEGSPASILMALGPIALMPLNRLLTKDRAALLTQVVTMTGSAWAPYLADQNPGLKHFIVFGIALVSVVVAFLAKRYFKTKGWWPILIGAVIGVVLGTGLYLLVSRLAVIEHHSDVKEDVKGAVVNYWLIFIISFAAVAAFSGLGALIGYFGGKHGAPGLKLIGKSQTPTLSWGVIDDLINEYYGNNVLVNFQKSRESHEILPFDALNKWCPATFRTPNVLNDAYNLRAKIRNCVSSQGAKDDLMVKRFS